MGTFVYSSEPVAELVPLYIISPEAAAPTWTLNEDWLYLAWGSLSLVRLLALTSLFDMLMLPFHVKGS